MFKHKNDDYRVPRREKFFRLLTLLGLLLALAILMRDVLKSPEAALPDNRYCSDGQVILSAIDRGGKIYLDCGGVLFLEHTLKITKDTHIVGAGEYSLAISGMHIQPVLFEVTEGSALYLENLRVVDSLKAGIQVDAGGELFLKDCQFSGHTGQKGQGAAIRNQGGQVYMEGCTFMDNGPAAGPVIYNLADSLMEIRSGVFRSNPTNLIKNNGTLSIFNTLFDHNRGGITSRGVALLENITFQYQVGDVLYNSGDGRMTLRHVIFDRNSVSAAVLVNSGEMRLWDVRFTGNSGRNCRITSDGTIENVSLCN